MLVAFETRVGYVEIVLKGAFGERDAPEISTRFEAFLTGAPPEDASYACILLNMREATMVSRRVFAALVGYAALLRLRGKTTVVAWPTEVVRGFIEESRTQALLVAARDDSEAFQTMVQSLHREYNSDFFAFLVNGQYLTKDQLRKLTAEHRSHGGKVSMERLLVDSKIFGWKTLLAAHVRFRVQKTPPPVVRPADAAPAAGLFGAPAELLAGRAAPRPLDAPDPFEAAAAASTAMGEDAAVESEFVQPRLLGSILVELKVLTDVQLREVLDQQRAEGKREKLGDLLVRMGLVTDDQLFKALEQQFRRRRPTGRPSGGRSEFVRRSLLGEILVELGLLTERSLREALEEHRASSSREKLGAVLLRLGLVSREQVLTALEMQASRKAGRPETAPARGAEG
jgi:hypothetical protein